MNWFLFVIGNPEANSAQAKIENRITDNEKRIIKKYENRNNL